MRLADKAYILTGLFFPRFVDQEFLGEKYASNAFFPILYFAAFSPRYCIYSITLVQSHCFYLCHWRSLGRDAAQAQQERLVRDFLAAISLVYRYLECSVCRSLKDRILLWPPAMQAYRRRLVEMKGLRLACALRLHTEGHCGSSLVPHFLQWGSCTSRENPLWSPDRMSFSSQ